MPRKNQIFEYLLSNLEKTITVVEDIIFPYKGFDPRKAFTNKQTYRRSLSNLEKQGQITKKGDRFYLTLRGKIALIKSSSDKLKLKRSKWDGRWRIVAFDIPESKRKNRRYLREYLYCLGFKRLQQSIWITPNPITYKDLAEVFDNAIIEKLVFIETKTISNQKEIKSWFDL